MSARIKLALCATVALAGFEPASPVFAQSDQPAASGGTGLEEIVVTARRREERVQTVPVAITAFSQVDLDKAHIGQLRDLYKTVPSLAVSYSSSDPNSFYSGQVRLRGLGGVEIYFADIPITSADYSTTTGLTHGLSPGLYFDLDDVEVDKGAQGTLFGRPSIGGLISIQPKRPTSDFDGYIKTTFGNYSDKENEFVVNVPVVSDKLMIRVGGQMQERDGYTLDKQTGDYLDNRNYYAWRIGVTFRPTDNIENYLLYDGYWQDSDGASDVLTVVNPNLKLAGIPLPGIGTVPLTIGNGLPIAALETPATATATYLALLKIFKAGGHPSLAIYSNLEQILQEQQALGARETIGRYSSGIGKDYFYGFTDVATWDITDTLRLKNIAAARVFKQLGVDDFTNTGLSILTIGWPGNNHGWTDNSVQYTEELQLSGKAIGDRLDWRVGGFLLFDHPLGYNTEVSDAVGTPTFDHFHEEQRSQAIFAHGIYDLSDYVDNLKFTAGYRYTWDYDSLGEVSTKSFDYPTLISGVPNCQNNRVFNPTKCFAQVDSNFNSPGWNVGLDEQLTPNLLLYVRSGNAYRPGGTNLAVPAPFNRYNPEHATDVELGVKADWSPTEDIHARTNFAMFHTFYKAIQVAQVVAIPSSTPGGTPSAQSITANAASANLDGMELEQTVNLPFGLDVKATGSYFYSKYDNYPTAFGQVGAPGFQYIPPFQFSVTPTYHVPIDPSLGQLDVSLAWSWYGHQSTSPLLNEPLREQPHFENIDINVDWDNVFNQPFDASFFMTNATDNLHIVGEIPLMTSLGFSSVAYNPPRMYGFSLKYRFDNSLFGGEAAATAYTPPPVVAPAPAPAAVARSYMVFFDFNKSDLTADAVKVVDQAAANAGPAKATEITVTGHTDTVGSDAYNMRLSQRRAQSVATELEKNGIAGSEIAIVAKGKRDLLVPTKDGVREPQNRRVTIVYGGGPTS
jgi:iron complex outermembrane receptor protein